MIVYENQLEFVVLHYLFDVHNASYRMRLVVGDKKSDIFYIYSKLIKVDTAINDFASALDAILDKASRLSDALRAEARPYEAFADRRLSQQHEYPVIRIPSHSSNLLDRRASFFSH